MASPFLHWPSRAALCRALFVALLVGQGVALYAVLPPEPRWSVHDAVPHVADFSADGATVCCWRWDKAGEPACKGPLTVYDAHTGTLQHTLDLGRVTDYAYSADGRYVAAFTPDGHVTLAELATGQTCWKRRVCAAPCLGWVRFAPDGEHLSAHDNLGTLHLLTTRTGQLLHQQEGYAQESAFSRDGHYFACEFTVTNGPPHSVRVWSLRDEPGSALIENASLLTLSSDSRQLVVTEPHVDFRKYDLIFWDLRRGAEQTRRTVESGVPCAAYFSPDQRLLAVVIDQGGESCLEIWDVRAARPLGKSEPMPGRLWRGQNATCGIWSPDSSCFTLLPLHIPLTRYVLAAPSCQRLWEASESEISEDLCWQAFSPDSLTVLVLQMTSLEWRAAANGSKVAAVEFPPIMFDEAAVQATPDGRFLLVGYKTTQGNFDPGFLAAWLAWLPGGWFEPRELEVFRVIDIQAARTVTQVTCAIAGRRPKLSADGRAMLIDVLGMASPGDSGWLLQCYDVPARKPWRWVLGPPLSLAGLVLSWQILRGRRKLTIPTGNGNPPGSSDAPGMGQRHERIGLDNRESKCRLQF
jgi:YD repeat-containing protein